MSSSSGPPPPLHLRKALDPPCPTPRPGVFPPPPAAPPPPPLLPSFRHAGPDHLPRPPQGAPPRPAPFWPRPPARALWRCQEGPPWGSPLAGFVLGGSVCSPARGVGPHGPWASFGPPRHRAPSRFCLPPPPSSHPPLVLLRWPPRPPRRPARRYIVTYRRYVKETSQMTGQYADRGCGPELLGWLAMAGRVTTTTAADVTAAGPGAAASGSADPAARSAVPSAPVAVTSAPPCSPSSPRSRATATS